MKEKIRQIAIQRYLKREKPKTIYSDLNRSKQWFFKWLNRFKSGRKDWYKEHSRAPNSSPTKISEILEQQIVEIRKRLETSKFAQTGASAVKWELNKSGYDLPSDRTINRVIKKEGLVKKNFLCSQGR